MFFEKVTTEWGEVLFMPTKQGEALLTYAIAALLLIAMLCIQFRGQSVTARKLAFCSLVIVFAAITANIKYDFFATGGNVTMFSMLIITLAGYWYGVGAGIATGMAFGLFQMIIDPYLLFPAQISVDYLFAFGALGLSGLFAGKKNGLILGYIVGVIGRYIFAVISGWIFFGAYAWEGWHPFTYSIVYNATYIFIEAGITIIVLMIPAVKTVIKKLSDVALEVNIESDNIDANII